MSEGLDFNDVSPDSFHLICRLCLCAGQMEPLFDSSKLEMYRRITLLEAIPDDKLPTNICNFCSNRLEAISAFVETCLNSYSALKKIVEKFVFETSIDQSILKNDQFAIDLVSEKFTVWANVDLESILNGEKLLSLGEKCDNCKTVSDEDSHETASATSHKSVLEEIETDLKDCDIVFSILSTESEEVKLLKPAPKVVAIEEQKCEKCGEIVKSFWQHYKKNRKCRPKNFLCGICGKNFVNNYALSCHLRSHSKEKPFKCKSCLKSFSYRNNLTRHELIHKGIKTLLCHFCGKVHLRQDDLRICMNKHAGKKISEYKPNQKCKTMVECKVCKKLVNKVSIKIHMQCHDKQFQCNICGKKFSNKYTLAIHVRSHTGEKPFKCNICNKDFTTKKLLNVHIMFHTGEKPFNCNVCNKDFTTKGELKLHNMCHTGEKPLECNFCSKRFRQRTHLKVHMMTHTGEKAHVCDICNRGFIMKGNFVAHKRLHTGERPFKCKLCDKSYCDRSTLRKHVIKAHKNDDCNK